MSRPWAIWMVLVVCGLLIVGAMGWLTDRILGMEEERAVAEAGAELEERVRLGLSRMDTAASGVLVLENQRQPEHYQAFFSPEDLYTNTFRNIASGLVLQVSPLLSDPQEFVHLHFEVGANRHLSSPQVPTGNQRDLAEVSGVTVEELERAAAQLKALERLLNARGPQGQVTRVTGTNLDWILLACSPNVAAWNDMPVEALEEKTNWMADQRQMVGNQVRQQLSYQQDLSLVDQGQRAKVYENTLNKAAQSAVKKGSRRMVQSKDGAAQGQAGQGPHAEQMEAQLAQVAEEMQSGASAPAPASSSVASSQVGDVDGPGAVADPLVIRQAAGAFGNALGSVVTPFRPVWLGGELFAVRHVRTASGERYQGVWLQAGALKAYLLESVGDQLPDADLVRVDALVGDTSVGSSLEGAFGAGGTTNPDTDPRALVTMPWRLDVGERIVAPPMAWTPLRVSLGMGWVAVVLAMFAAAALVRGVIKMSERRASFVSSVTHELRTPLTTFQLYSDMLAEGMVQDETKRQEYLNTLRVEAGRLNHLIENVLAYSRIERGSARAQREKLSLGSLIGRIEGRLTDRVEREGARIEIEGIEACADVTIDTDVTAVEQIVFNLVDNACKYGLPDDGDRFVSLRAGNGGKMAHIEICDNGQGIVRGDAKKLFRPFHKSAKDAAHSKPGVGLGLALCRRLARALGGDLTIDSKRDRGACFVLELPLAG